MPDADEGRVEWVAAGGEPARVCAAADYSADCHRRRSHSVSCFRSSASSSASCRRRNHREFSKIK